MEGVQQSAVFSRVGEPCLVTVPDPARMAIHKLIVSGQQSDVGSGTFVTKANKDIEQAASLIAFYAERSPSQMVAAYEDAMSRGPKWRAAVEIGLKRLRSAFPTLALAWITLKRHHGRDRARYGGPAIFASDSRPYLAAHS